jgi:hypothetical protein
MGRGCVAKHQVQHLPVDGCFDDAAAALWTRTATALKASRRAEQRRFGTLQFAAPGKPGSESNATLQTEREVAFVATDVGGEYWKGLIRSRRHFAEAGSLQSWPNASPMICEKLCSGSSSADKSQRGKYF